MYESVFDGAQKAYLYECQCAVYLASSTCLYVYASSSPLYVCLFQAITARFRQFSSNAQHLTSTALSSRRRLGPQSTQPAQSSQVGRVGRDWDYLRSDLVAALASAPISKQNAGKTHFNCCLGQQHHHQASLELVGLQRYLLGVVVVFRFYFSFFTLLFYGAVNRGSMYV